MPVGPLFFELAMGCWRDDPPELVSLECFWSLFWSELEPVSFSLILFMVLKVAYGDVLWIMQEEAWS